MQELEETYPLQYVYQSLCMVLYVCRNDSNVVTVNEELKVGVNGAIHYAQAIFLITLNSHVELGTNNLRYNRGATHS